MTRILVIDDDERMRNFVGQLLEGEGYEVTLAADGELGLRLFRECAADLVITDIIMPGVEGMETIYRLREDAPDLPIVAISGGSLKGAGSYLGTAEQLGANRTLAKPFSAKILLAYVEELLHHTCGNIETPNSSA